MKPVVLEAFRQGRARLDGGARGAEALRYIVRLPSRGLSSASDTEVRQRLTILLVATGTPPSEYIVELRGMVSNLQQFGLEHISGEGVQLALKASLSDQYPSIGIVIFRGKVHSARCFASVAAFLDCLDEFDQNTISAQASSRFCQSKAPDIVRRAANPGRKGYDGGGMAVARAGNDLEEEKCEIRQVFAVFKKAWSIWPQQQTRSSTSLCYIKLETVVGCC